MPSQQPGHHLEAPTLVWKEVVDSGSDNILRAKSALLKGLVFVFFVFFLIYFLLVYDLLTYRKVWFLQSVLSYNGCPFVLKSQPSGSRPPAPGWGPGGRSEREEGRVDNLTAEAPNQSPGDTTRG